MDKKTMVNIPHKSIFFSWLVSYFVIIVICLLVSIVMYVQAESIVRTEINHADSLILKQICHSIDSRLTDIKSLSYQISLDKNLKGLYYIKDPMTNDDRYVEKEIIDDFKLMKSANSFVDNFYVYFNGIDSLPAADGTYDKDIMYDLHFKKTGLSYDEWKRLHVGSYTGDFIPLYTKTNTEKKQVLYLKSLLLNDRKNSVTLGIIFDEAKLFDAIKDLNIENQSTVLIIDKQNNIISSTSGSNISGITYDSLKDVRGVAIQDRGKMVVSHIDSQEADWKYVVCVPSNIYTEKIQMIRLITLISILLCLVIGSITAYLFAKSHYIPVRKITKFVGGLQKNDLKTDNEFNIINSFIHNTYNEKEKYYKGWEKHKDWLQRNFLLRLLRGELPHKAELNEILQTHDIKFESDFFGVLLYKIEDYSRLFEEENYEAFHMTKFAVSNVAQELGSSKNLCFTVECDDLVCCIINFRQERPGMDEELYRIASECKTFYEDKMELFVSVSTSSVHRGISEIHTAYQEAMEALKFRLIVGDEKVIKFADTMSAQTSFIYSMDTENNFFNCIRAGESEKANLILDDIFEANFTARNISVDMARCLIVSIINTIMQVINECNCNDGSFKMMLDSLNHILSHETISGMKSEISELIDEICRRLNCSQNKSKYDAIRKKLCLYLDKNYMDMNLNVTGVAEALQINPVILSRIFKEAEGKTLIDFINKTRIEKSKELLKSTQMNIGEISEKVGYSNPNTYIRIFKKYEGITPGKFKKSVPYE